MGEAIKKPDGTMAQPYVQPHPQSGFPKFPKTLGGK